MKKSRICLEFSGTCSRICLEVSGTCTKASELNSNKVNFFFSLVILALILYIHLLPDKKGYISPWCAEVWCREVTCPLVAAFYTSNGLLGHTVVEEVSSKRFTIYNWLDVVSIFKDLVLYQ